MGQKTAASAKDRSHPSVVEIVEEIRAERARQMAYLVPLSEVVDALGKPNAGGTYHAIKLLGVKKLIVGGRTHVTQDDAVKIAERLA